MTTPHYHLLSSYKTIISRREAPETKITSFLAFHHNACLQFSYLRRLIHLVPQFIENF